MKKLLICAMTAGLFMMGGVQESVAFNLKKADKSEDTGTSVKKKLTGIFKKKSSESDQVAEGAISDKNKALVEAISDLRKKNKILRGKGDEKYTKRTTHNAKCIEEIYTRTDILLTEFKKYFKGQLRGGISDVESTFNAEGNEVVKNLAKINAEKLSNQDKNWLGSWHIAYRPLANILLKSDEIDVKKTLYAIDEQMLKTIGRPYYRGKLLSSKEDSSNNDYKK